MTRVSVDLDLLDALVAEMAAFGQRFAVVHEDIDTRMRQVRARWDGAAAAEQALAHDRWTAGASEMHESLARLRAIASTAQQNYSAAMRAGLQMWAR